jgi:hypothetical protein
MHSMIYKMASLGKQTNVHFPTLQQTSPGLLKINMEHRRGYEDELNSHRSESGTALRSIAELMLKNGSGLLKCISL